MDVLKAIMERSSPVRLDGPAPSDNERDIILTAGARAPDHGRLTPWRFVVIEGEARSRFGTILADSLAARDPAATSKALAQEATKALRAPLIIAVAAQVRDHKVPIVEQMMAGAAGIENMILAAGALGFGALWKTGHPAYDEGVVRALGLAPECRIVGFVYIGTAVATKAPRAVSLSELVHSL